MVALLRTTSAVEAKGPRVGVVGDAPAGVSAQQACAMGAGVGGDPGCGGGGEGGHVGLPPLLQLVD